MLINLAELFSLDGKEKTYSPELEMKFYSAPVGDCEVVGKGPANLRAVHTGNRVIEVTGTAKLSLSIPCDRCLTPVRVDFDLEIERTLDFSEAALEDKEILAEQPYVNGYNLDVDQLVCDELILNLPMKVLCSENCKGICNRCGANLNFETCDCDTRSPDPRMAVIQDIFKQFKEV